MNEASHGEQPMGYAPAIEIVLTGTAALLLVLYHWHLLYAIRNSSAETSFGRNAKIRTAWVVTVMRNDRDILAIQTLRNWTMAASFLASTAILIALSILSVVLTADKSMETSQLFNYFGTRSESLRLVKFVLLSLDFFFAFLNFTLAIRYYNHVGLMINVPVGEEPLVDVDHVSETITLAATHYTLGMRGYYLAIPLAMWLFGPTWFLLGSIILLAILYYIDRTG